MGVLWSMENDAFTEGVQAWNTTLKIPDWALTAIK